MPAEVGLKRALARGGEARFESKGLGFHERLGEAFLEIARREPERCVVIEADGAIEAVWADVWSAVSTRLGL
jgi:dTMP kinase